MPTPFYHLWIAQGLLEHPALGADTQLFLSRQRAAFLFGHTAPDVQTISQQPRQVTHFFDLPCFPGQLSPVDALLAACPQLSLCRSLPAPQAAFLAGYLCHLHADWLWVRLIFEPVFGSGASWAGTAQRLYIHNVVRAYWDRLVIPALAADTGACLEQARPHSWLPFVDDSFLRQWRDFLHPQLQAHTPVRTVEVFATRQGIPPETYYRLLDSKERMEQEVFVYFSPQQMEVYRSRLLFESVQLLRRYLEYPLSGVFHQPSIGVGYYETS